MTGNICNGWWLFGQFLRSNGYGFPGGSRWLRRLKGSVCNQFDRFQAPDFDRFLLMPYREEGSRGVGSAVLLGHSLAGWPGALGAAVGLLFPWLLLELLPDTMLHWCSGHPLRMAACVLTRAAVLAGALLGALDLELAFTAPVELFFVAGGLLDAVFGWVPPELILLAAGACQVWRVRKYLTKRKAGGVTVL